MTQEQLAQRLGIGKAALSMIETGKSGLSSRNKNILIQDLNVNPDWLMHGTGEMFLERDSGDEIAEFLASILDDDDTSIRKRFILALSKFDGDDWATVEKFLDNFTKTEKDGD